MSYTKHNYKKGDELLASQLNEMDDQIALNEEKFNASMNALEPNALTSDVGKYLKVNAVINGKVSQYIFDTPPAPTDAQVTSAVNTWLGNNIAQETGYALDRTLSVANAAAPADLVGDIVKVIDDDANRESWKCNIEKYENIDYNEILFNDETLVQRTASFIEKDKTIRYQHNPYSIHFKTNTTATSTEIRINIY